MSRIVEMTCASVSDRPFDFLGGGGGRDWGFRVIPSFISSARKPVYLFQQVESQDTVFGQSENKFSLITI